MYDQKIEKRITLLRAEFNLESNKPISVSRLEKRNSNKGMKLGVLQYSTIAGWFNHVIAATLSQPIHWVEYYPTWTALLLLQKHGITTSDNEKHSLCSAGNQQQCFSLLPNQHQSSATSQLAVLFSYNKSTPATSHSQPNGANIIS